MATNILQSIENKLRYLLEEKLDRLLFPGLSGSLSNTLIDLIQKHIDGQSDLQTKQMPDLIILQVSADRWDAWQGSLPLLDEVSQLLGESWREAGYQLKKNPVIQILQSPELSANQLKVETATSVEEVTSRQTALLKISRTIDPETLPQDACLIIKDREPFYLKKAIIKIGRRSSNDVVLDDPMVSRDHIQLRADNGRFFLFDLGSTGGTKVNNYPAHNQVLKPGDVIQIGKTTLIYNQTIEQSTSKPTRTLSEGLS